MTLKEFIGKLMSKEKEIEELPEGETSDRVLRSLRNENRRFDEEEEKEALKIRLMERKKDRVRKHTFGIKDELKDKEVKIMDENPLLKENNLMNDNKAMASKGNLLNQKSIMRGNNILKNNKSLLKNNSLLKGGKFKLL